MATIIENDVFHNVFEKNLHQRLFHVKKRKKVLRERRKIEALDAVFDSIPKENREDGLSAQQRMRHERKR